MLARCADAVMMDARNVLSMSMPCMARVHLSLFFLCLLCHRFALVNSTSSCVSFFV